MDSDEKRMMNRVATALEKIAKILDTINTNLVAMNASAKAAESAVEKLKELTHDANQLELPTIVDESGKRWADQKGSVE